MLELPTPLLGNTYAITISTTNLEASLAFYQKLGFAEVMRYDVPFSWIQISDGALLIMLRKDDKPYIALTYYINSMEQTYAELVAKGIPFSVTPVITDAVPRAVAVSPDGHYVTLAQPAVGTFNQPDGNTLLTTPPADYTDTGKYANKTCGIFGEFALPVANLDTSIAFYEKLGFKALSKMNSGYPWAILSDGLSIVGLHQTTHFTAPAITYFAADMPAKIENLKAAGLTNMVEQGVGNAVVTSPEGQTINLFKLGM